ncbi:hypothetical protein A8709_11160 [Paenibacillus pectinilyticus]|uniref:Major facilitator superfamily (MFS) profile domain-containing protein n=1 Tax=Paenibacillus pectinilyticus TaxID=512399 RepID=A0A1C1A2T9_9BACL|nr:DHA2 family efflux MFS transporter permease subunit [Paenibacillus pectinilyticus]OCT14838.1 hypothetical protein A8709_11160 [Paenibacillus pectinilyticus]
MEKEADEATEYRVYAILFALLTAGFVGLYSETALNMAFTDLIDIFGIRPSDVQWLTTGYLLTLGILAPVSGFLLKWFSSRQLFIVALGFSIVGTMIAALAPYFSILLFARIIQAIGTGLLMPLMFNTILIIFPVAKRGAAMGLVGLVILFAPAVGPTLSGFVIEKLTWNWIFWFSLPLLVSSLVCGIVVMKNTSDITRPKIDILSIVLSTLGFGGIVFGFSSLGESGEGWGSPVVIVSLAIGVVSLALFIIRQLLLSQPMINLRAFHYPMFTLGMLMVFLCMMVILSSSVLLPMYLQGGLTLTALTAGLVLLPGSFINGLISPVIGRLFDRVGPKWMVTPGYILVSTMLWVFSNVTPDTSKIMIIVVHTCLMTGISLIMMPSQTNGLNQLPRELYPDGTAIMNTLQQVAGAIGTTVAVTVMSSEQAKYASKALDASRASTMSASLTAGVQMAFIYGIVVAILGLIVSVFFKRVAVKQQEKYGA